MEGARKSARKSSRSSHDAHCQVDSEFTAVESTQESGARVAPKLPGRSRAVQEMPPKKGTHTHTVGQEAE